MCGGRRGSAQRGGRRGDAADGLAPRGISDFLLHASAGRSRLYVVGLLAAGLVAAAAGRRRVAAVPALAALGAVAFSGHANAGSPRGLALVSDWLHLTSAAVWTGGAAVLVLAWGPALRRDSRAARLDVARSVLPTFGRIALPAFGVVLVTGLVSSVVELGRPEALWQSDYGRVLMIKIDVVALVVAASYQHARRLRPRLLDPARRTPDRLERRHWRLLRAEPLLAVGVVAAVAVLAAFPLPPKQLDAAGTARAAPGPACAPCPLPAPREGELAVAGRAGSSVVAAWVRREGRGLAGTVRVFGIDKAPRAGPVTVLGAVQSVCGRGCRRFRLPTTRPALAVVVPERGRRYRAQLTTVWRPDGGASARRVLRKAQGVMRALRSVREVERVSSVPGLQATTRYTFQAPDRMAFATDLGVRSVVRGRSQWMRERDTARYRRVPYGGGLPFRTRSWFTWTTYAQHTYFLRQTRERGRTVDVIGLMDPGTPAWWTLHVDRRTRRVLSDELVTYGHFSSQRFSHFNVPVRVRTPPPGAVDGP